MNKTLLLAALAALCIAPALATACEYNDAAYPDPSWASTAPAKLAVAPAPAASRVPVAVVKAQTAKAGKHATAKATSFPSDHKLAAATAD